MGASPPLLFPWESNSVELLEIPQSVEIKIALKSYQSRQNPEIREVGISFPLQDTCLNQSFKRFRKEDIKYKMTTYRQESQAEFLAFHRIEKEKKMFFVYAKKRP